MQRESVSSYAIIQSVLYEDVAVDCFIVILQPIHSYDRDAIDSYDDQSVHKSRNTQRLVAVDYYVIQNAI